MFQIEIMLYHKYEKVCESFASVQVIITTVIMIIILIKMKSNIIVLLHNRSKSIGPRG